MNRVCAPSDNFRQLMEAASVTEPPNPSMYWCRTLLNTLSPTLFQIDAKTKILITYLLYIYGEKSLQEYPVTLSRQHCRTYLQEEKHPCCK